MPAELPPHLAERVTEMLEENTAAGAGEDGPMDFWTWVNGRLAKERVRAQVPAVPAARSKPLQAPPAFDLDEALKHVHRQLPEVWVHHRSSVSLVGAVVLKTCRLDWVYKAHEDYVFRLLGC
jgi:hypothetical protein